MFDSDHARRGFTSLEGETGLSQHQNGSTSPDVVQTCNYYQEPLRGCPESGEWEPLQWNKHFMRHKRSEPDPPNPSATCKNWAYNVPFTKPSPRTEVSPRSTRGSGSAQIRATNFESDDPEAYDPVEAPPVKSSSRLQTEPTRQDFVPTKKLKKTCLFHCEGILFRIIRKQKRKRFFPCPQAKLLFRSQKILIKVEIHLPNSHF
jgi:hypothetical protein